MSSGIDPSYLDSINCHNTIVKAPGNYFFTFRECFLDIMAITEAVVLQKLINRLNYLVKNHPERMEKQGYWFCFSVKQTTDSLRLTKDQQSMSLSKLRGIKQSFKKNPVVGGIRTAKHTDPESAFIKIKKKGVPAKRYVWIDFLKLNTALLRAAAKKRPSSSAVDPNILRTLPYLEYLETQHWKEVRADCLKRDGWSCRLCNRKTDLHVHHRTYENRGCEKPEDVITLCKTCHERHHGILPESGEGGAV